MENTKKSLFQRTLDVIEKIGSRLPDPFVLFLIFAVLIVVISVIATSLGASTVHPSTGEVVEVRSLLSREGIEFILTETVSNFTGFAPLGLVLAMMLGVGLVEKVGFFDYVIRKTLLKAPPFILTYTVVFVGIMGNIASDASAVIIPPLAALVFYKVGRHPLAGLAAGFAGAGAGFTANLLVAGTDVLLSGISTEAARIIDPEFVVTPLDNYFFNVVSVFMLTIIGGLITTRFIEPRLGTYEGAVEDEEETEVQNGGRGVLLAVIASVIYWGLIVGGFFLPNSYLAGEDGGFLNSPLLKGIVPVILVWFMIVGVTFGFTTKVLKTSTDVTNKMAEAIKDMAPYIVLVFAIAQFIAYFNWSNLAIWLAVNGAAFFESIQFTGIPLIILYVIFTGLLNFLITSGSAKWALEAPVFIPMFMQLGYDPAFVQAAYRIADSSMNIVTPLYPLMIVIIAFMRRYDKNSNIGTYMSLMIPYAFSFLFAWIILLLVFYYTGLPLGPGAYTLLESRG